MQPARIAFCDGYALTEGAGLVLLDLVRRIDRTRFEPIALLPRDGPLARPLAEAGCPVTVLPPPAPLGAYGQRLIRQGVVPKLQAALALARYSLPVERWLRANRVDVVHCNQTRAAVQMGPGARLARIPMLWNVRIHERMPPALVRLAGACSSLIVPLTEETFRGQPAEQRLLRRARVIRNAVDLERFHLSPSRRRTGEAGEGPVILSAGVLVQRKGFDLLIAAMPAIRERLPGARLLIAGAAAPGVDSCEGQLRDMIAQRGLQSAVKLLGRREEMPALMAEADIFALASRYEGDPAVVLEAMASGLPVIVTPEAASAVEHGRTGIVAPAEDPDALAEAVCGLAAEPARARLLAAAAREQVEQHHDMREMVRHYERAWASLLGEDV